MSVVVASSSTLYAAVNTQDRAPVYLPAPTPGYYRSNDGGVSWVNVASESRPATSVRSATGVPNNMRKSYLVFTSMQSYLSGDLFNYSPSSVTILQGTRNSGSPTSLAASDGNTAIQAGRRQRARKPGEDVLPGSIR